jgi:hypothetical protein
VRCDRPDAKTNEEASAQLQISVKDPDPEAVGRRFSSAVVELALSNYPGLYLTSAPTEAGAYGVYWPTLIPRGVVEEVVVHDDGRRERVGSPTGAQLAAEVLPEVQPEPGRDVDSGPAAGPTRRLALGTVVGARSGDKGPNANVGMWARDDSAFEWIRSYLSIERFRELFPEAATLAVDRYELANLRALNFVVHGLLGQGVASSTRPDPQAKSLGEYLRSRLVDVPVSLAPDQPSPLDEEGRTRGTMEGGRGAVPDRPERGAVPDSPVD